MRSFRSSLCLLALAVLLAVSLACSSDPPAATSPSPTIEPTSANPEATAPGPQTASPTPAPATATGVPATPAPSATPPPAGTLSASQILQDAIPATDGLSSFRMHNETSIAYPDDEALLVMEIETTREVAYLKLSLLASITEAIVRVGDGGCLRFGSEEWQLEEADAVGDQPGFESYFDLLREATGPAFSSPVRHEDETLDDGREVYVITSSLSSAEVPEGLLDLLDSLSDIEAFTIHAKIEKDTSYLAVLQWDLVATDEDGDFSATSTATYDRYNQPIRLPEDLPPACASLAS